MNLTYDTKRTIRHLAAICAAFAIGALGAQAQANRAPSAPSPTPTSTAPLGTRLQTEANRTSPDAEVIWDPAAQTYHVEMKRASHPIQEDDPEWDCTRMGNRICGSASPAR